MNDRDIKKIVAQELVKCKQDPAYFMKKYCFIQHPTRGRIPFHLYLFQEKVLHLFKDNQNLIVLKSRQLGISTLAAGYSLWLMLFHQDKNVLALATTQATARNLVTKVQFMYENLPKWLQIKSVEHNKLSLRLVNGSRIKAASSNSDAARSEAVSLLLIDEAAFIDNIEDTFASAQQTLATGGQCLTLSCVTKDTYIITEKGIQQIQDLLPEENLPGFTKTSEYNIQGFKNKRSSNLIFNNGNVDTRVIKTRYSVLEGSNNHKVYASTRAGYRWCRLDELEVGDYVNVMGGYRTWGNNDIIEYKQSIGNGRKELKFETKEITEDLSYLFGLYLAEGSSNGKNSIDIVCGDSEDIDNQLSKLNINYTQHKGRLGKRLCSSNLVDLFKHVGFNLENTASSKVIPKRLLQVSEKNIIGLLQGLFDGDGTVTLKGTVGYTSTSRELILQIRMLLLNLGIYSNLYIRTAEDANNYTKRKVKEGAAWASTWSMHKKDAYILEMYGEDVKRFKELVGFRVKRKNEKLNKYLKSKLKSSRTNCKNVIPNSKNLIQELHHRSKLTQYRFIKETEVNLSNILNKTTPRFTNHISTEVFLKVYTKWKHLLNVEEIKYWEDIIDNKSRWVPVVEITRNVNNTYDVSLPNKEDDFWCHSVLYNGILGHQTPNGVGNWFHRTWQKAETRENTFLPVKLPWTVHPERTQEWRDQQDADLGPRMAAQECDTDFLSSGDTVFLPEDLIFYETTNIQEPLERRGLDGNLWVWENPDYNSSYMVVADVARGDSTDYSTFHVLDIERAVQVAEFKSKLSPKDFGNVLVGIASEYNDALLVVENANIGWATIEQILSREYKNLYYSSRSENETVESYMNKFENDKLVPGFTNSMRTRPLLIAKMMEYVREHSVTLRSKRLLEEMRVFVWKNGKAQSQIGYNDDLVIAFAIGLFVRDSALRLRQQGMDLARAQLSSFSNLNQRTPKIITTNNFGNNPFKTQTAYGEEDFSWVLK